ncbi:MAG: glycerol-3-phosphate 1-O-acyltransferase PlsY [Pseudomonadota bacterium]|jgi:glycerol-3-phosphate acyltransferase PlsY
MTEFFPLLAIGAAYLIGSLSFAVIVSHAMGLHDPRTYGSKNPGATNVLRSGSKKAAVITLLLDALKGFFPVILIQQWGAHWDLGHDTAALAGMAAFLGHLFPVFFRFQGGKGVATALGVLLALHWMLGLLVLLTWGLMAWRFRYSSLASLTAAIMAPIYYVLLDGTLWRINKSAVLCTAVMAIFLIWRHAENINRLLKGTESRIK